MSDQGKQQPADPFSGVKFPDKFVKDGKPDLVTFVNSYGELETKFNTKTEDLQKTVRADLEKEFNAGKVESADKYVLPKIDGVDEKELAEHPLLKSFRDDAHKMGMTQPQFEGAVKKYIEISTPKEPDMEAVNKALGDNAKARISQVETWAKSYAKNDGEMAALQGIASSAEGIMLIERLANLKPDVTDAGSGGGPDDITPEKLKEMQADPRYWNPNKRDPAFVKQVEDGYKKLYPEKK